MQNKYAGIAKIAILEKSRNITFPAFVMYPTTIKSKIQNIGPFSVKATNDAEIKEGKYPLVVISHGGGGNFLGYLTIVQFLAEQGFIVVMIEHYKNNRNDNQLEGEIENLENRPKHISLTIDEMLKNRFKDYIDKEKIVVIGHSMGGYTALALTGGIPYTKEAERVKTVLDKRVKAIILFAPATAFFNYNNSLDNVKNPILFFSAEKDELTTLEEHKSIINKQLSHNKNVVFEIVENAGHFSFLSPFPKSMRNPNFLPSTDPKGFNRDRFHLELNKKIYDFLEKNLRKSNNNTAQQKI